MEVALTPMHASLDTLRPLAIYHQYSSTRVSEHTSLIKSFPCETLKKKKITCWHLENHIQTRKRHCKSLLLFNIPEIINYSNQLFFPQDVPFKFLLKIHF